MNELAEKVEFEDEEVAQEKTLNISEDVRNAFAAGKNVDKNQDGIMIDMLQAGAKFSHVRKFYKELSIELGYEAAPEVKDAALEAALEVNDISTEEGFDAAVAHITGAVEQINERGAGQMIRGYARKHNLEFFRKPKPEATGQRVAFTNNFYRMLVENPTINEEETHEYIVEHGSEATLKAEKSYQKIRVLANRIAEKYAV